MIFAPGCTRSNNKNSNGNGNYIDTCRHYNSLSYYFTSSICVNDIGYRMIALFPIYRTTLLYGV